MNTKNIKNAITNIFNKGESEHVSVEEFKDDINVLLKEWRSMFTDNTFASVCLNMVMDDIYEWYDYSDDDNLEDVLKGMRSDFRKYTEELNEECSYKDEIIAIAMGMWFGEYKLLHYNKEV